MMKNTFCSIDRCSRAEACGGTRRQLRASAWRRLRPARLFQSRTFPQIVILSAAKNLKRAAVGIFFVFSAAAQEPPPPAFGNAETPHAEETLFPDALVHPTPWHPDFMSVEPARPRPAVTMTSVAEFRQENLPRRIVVLDNNVLRLGEHVTLSNGQAWHWGPFPDAFLDARTLSFPMPR